MDNIKSTTARLRRTFAYPTDEDSVSTDTPEAMDEEGKMQPGRDLWNM
jgi:hypothetical protein